MTLKRIAHFLLKRFWMIFEERFRNVGIVFSNLELKTNDFIGRSLNVATLLPLMLPVRVALV